MTVVGFFAREHGLNGLQALLQSDNYKVLALFTHRLKPLSEDPERSEREEYSQYIALTQKHHIPLYSIDSKKEESEIEKILSSLDFDYIASISWRRLIPSNILAMAKKGCINLHRGKLPNYPGAEPIKQALINRDKEITITAHVMTEVIDGGRTVAFYRHPVNYQENKTMEENIDRLKKEITPFFGPLLLESLGKI